MTEPYLRRGPQPEPGRSGRRVVIIAFLFLVALIVAVVVPLVLSGNGSGVKPPPDHAPVHTTPTAAHSS